MNRLQDAFKQISIAAMLCANAIVHSISSICKSKCNLCFFFPERFPVSQAIELLFSFDGSNSEVEDLSDIDDPVRDPEYQPSPQQLSSHEEDSSECEDPIPQSSKPIRGCKRLREEYKGYRSDRDLSRSHTAR